MGINGELIGVIINRLIQATLCPNREKLVGWRTSFAGCCLFNRQQFGLGQGVNSCVHILFAQLGQPHNSRTGHSRLSLNQAQDLLTLGGVIAEGDTSIVRLGVKVGRRLIHLDGFIIGLTLTYPTINI